MTRTTAGWPVLRGFVVTVLLGTLFVVVAAACGDGETATPAADEPAETTTSTSAEADADEDAPADTAPADFDDSTGDETPPDESAEPAAAEPLLPAMTVDPTEPVPRPLLGWAPVEGAARYSVVVLGADGRPYWAWSGTETVIPMGGIEDPELVGPWVHEPMTWTVAAVDGSGVPLALSVSAALVP